MQDLRAITSTGALRLTDAGGGVQVLEIDVPGRSVNVLTSAVLSDLERALEAIAGDPTVKALVVANGKPGTQVFIAGADIDEVRAVHDPKEATALARRGQEILGRLSRMPQPTVAAIGGTCLGGGTELALACDLRVAADDPGVEIGLPEVRLGIIPGFGGSTRLPRLIGVRPALDLILTGKRIDPRQAARVGLVDRVVPPPLLRESAAALAREAIGRGKRFRPGRRRRGLLAGLGNFLLERTPGGRILIRRAAMKRVEKESRGHYPAPPAAVDVVLRGYGRRFQSALALEAEAVGKLVASDVAKNLMAIFQASEALRKGGKGERTDDTSTAPPGRPPRRVAVLGAGVMGGGIAALLARRGFRVRLRDVRPEALTTALSHAAKSFDELLARRKIKRNERDNFISAISASTDMSGIAGVEMVIEAVVEDLKVKQEVLRQVEPLLGPSAVFASNTSALSITRMAEAAARPESVVGLHFFNPVHRMPLVEVVRGAATSEATLRAAERMARELGKYPVRVKDAPGFLVNRLLLPYLNEAAHLFAEGAPMEAVDRAMRDFGFPMGPFELLDEIGLDVAQKVAHTLHEAFGERAAPPPLLEKLVVGEKLLGKKAGAGFYLHRNGRKRRESGSPPPANPAVAKHNRPPAGHPTPPADAAGWERRMLYPMVNEAARCLEEEVVARPEEVNVATVFGIAFPPFRGGLLAYADKVGLPAIAEALKGFAAQARSPADGARFQPAEILVRLAAEGKTFAALSAAPAAAPPVPATVGSLAT